MESEPEQRDEVANLLRKLLGNLKEEYTKYIAVLHLFDPQAVGTMSEAILTKLLKGQPGVEDVRHVGGMNGHADIMLNGIPISVKTSTSGNNIGLGSSSYLRALMDQEKVSRFLEENDCSGINVGDFTLQSMFLGEEGNEAIRSVQGRLETIASKLAGDWTPCIFLWIEKIKNDQKEIAEIRFHVNTFSKYGLIHTFRTSRLKPTARGWSLVNKERVIVGADSSSKVLNITPNLIYEQERGYIPTATVTVPYNASLLSSEKQGRVTKELLNTLNSLYVELYENA